MANSALVVDKQFTATVLVDGELQDQTFGVGEVFDPALAEAWEPGTIENRIAHGFLKPTVISSAEETEQAAGILAAAHAEAKAIVEAAQAEAAALKLKAGKGKE